MCQWQLLILPMQKLFSHNIILKILGESKRNIRQEVMLRCNISSNSVKVLVSDYGDILGSDCNRMPNLHFVSDTVFTKSNVKTSARIFIN
jgi:hypothetical protein